MKPIQWKAVDLLAAGATQEKTAAECGVWPFTIRRWLKRPDFQDAMQKELQKLRELSRAQFSTIFENTRHERTRTDTNRTIPNILDNARKSERKRARSEHFSTF